MARNIPKALATFTSSDSDTSRLTANLQAAIQPLLDFNAKWFQAKGNVLNVLGAVQSMGATLLNSFRSVPDGTSLAPGLAFLNNGKIGFQRQGVGAQEQWNFRYNGVTFLSVTTSGAIWRNINSAGAMFFNNAAGSFLGSINDSGTVNFPSFVSAQGFKNTLPAGYVWYAGATTDTAAHQFNAVVVASTGTQTASLTTAGWVAPRSGSITGLSIYMDRTQSATWTFRASIGGTLTALLLSTTTSNSASFAKGTYAFTANQPVNLQFTITSAAAASSVVVQGFFEIELGA